MNLKRHISTRLIPVLAVTAFAVAGCGSSSGSGSSSSNANSQDAARVKFAQCLRDNGVDVPDNPGQNGGRQALQNVDRSKFQAAQKACQKYQRQAVGSISDAQRQEFRDAFTKFSSCMRQHGVDLPDPGTGGGGPPAGGGQINQNSPKVKAAQQACQDKLPQGGPGGPGGQGD